VKILKIIGTLVAALILLFLVVISLAVDRSRLLCNGQVKRNARGAEPVTTSATLYARVDRYRWFVLWMDHDAMINWEIQPGSYSGFGYYDESSFATPISDLQRTKTYGSFSSLSKRIYIETGFDGQEAFEGICQESRDPNPA